MACIMQCNKQDRKQISSSHYLTESWETVALYVRTSRALDINKDPTSDSGSGSEVSRVGAVIGERVTILRTRLPLNNSAYKLRVKKK